MHIFISYAKKDTRPIATILHDRLVAFPNVTAWMDESLEPVSSWARQIQAEIIRCDYMLVLLSPDVNRSEPHSFVLKEIAFAQQISKPIITVMAQKTIVPLEVVDMEYIDLTRDQAAGTNRLLNFIRGRAEPVASAASIQNSTPIEPVSARPVSDLANQPKPTFVMPTPASDAASKTPAPNQPAAVLAVSLPGVSFRARFSLPLLEWVKLPAGTVVLEDNAGTYRVDPFIIAKYPVTNEQFQTFIDNGGYQTIRYWDGLADRVTAPQKPTWSASTQPRESIHWYEAVAFTRWLTEKISLRVTLPTEWQWQWAAVGATGWSYPYGLKFDKGKGNTAESSLLATTPVDRYSQGASPFGVIDMCGNVWEWCLNEHNVAQNINISGTYSRGLRGGSWNSSAKMARSAYRFDYFPYDQSNNIGFRVAIASN